MTECRISPPVVARLVFLATMPSSLVLITFHTFEGLLGLTVNVSFCGNHRWILRFRFCSVVQCRRFEPLPGGQHCYWISGFASWALSCLLHWLAGTS